MNKNHKTEEYEHFIKIYNSDFKTLTLAKQVHAWVRTL